MAVPYNLKSTEGDSGKFYKKLQNVTAEIERYAVRFNPVIASFKAFLAENNSEIIRHDAEYMIEYLMIGMLWNRYIAYAMAQKFCVTQFSGGLAKLKRSNPNLRPEIDKVKADVVDNFLSKTTYEYAGTCLTNYKKLLDWLIGTDEFTEEVLRLHNWEQFFESLPEDDTCEILEQTISSAYDFEDKAHEALHEFTDSLFDFLEEVYSATEKREDAILRTKMPEEYHFNMIAIQILNNALHDEFIAKKHKVVLIPTCMCNDTENCKGETDGEIRRCKKCDDKCNIKQITEQLGDEAEIVVVRHASGFANVFRRWQNLHDTGFVGVSCVPSAINEALNLRKLNIVSQIVFLEECSCKKHWSDDGLPTCTSINRIKQILHG
ncbi:MAG: DUF116 domain-containing protein [Candidatus Kapabacteria bacterium]|nr:DUF116 domain-containing protein [Candidatus Kapabacteria bacterium]